MKKVRIPLTGRTFERTQGCYSCVHFASPEDSRQHWLTVSRPQEEARIAEAKIAILSQPADPAAVNRLSKTNRNERCPCGSGTKYKRCCLSKDEAAAIIFKRIEGIERAVHSLDVFESSITKGHSIIGYQGWCRNERAPNGSGFKDARYLCDQWSGAQGASVARAGAAPDGLPEEMMDKHGDGN